MLETIELGIGDTLTKNTHVTLVRFPCFYPASFISTGEKSPELCPPADLYSHLPTDAQSWGNTVLFWSMMLKSSATVRSITRHPLNFSDGV